MILSIPKARTLALAFLKKDDSFDMSMTSLLYLSIYKRRCAFEVRFNYPDNLLVDAGLPIVLIISAKEVLKIQSEESFDIMDYCKSRKK